MKIAIAGSGALGSGFGAMLYRQGNDVTLIDGWEPQATAVKHEGLHIDINGEDLSLIHISEPTRRLSRSRMPSSA